MQIPEACYDFCLLLHQDSFIFYGREPEDVAAVKPDALENAVAIQESVIEHGDLGVSLLDEFAIQVNFHDRPC